MLKVVSTIGFTGGGSIGAVNYKGTWDANANSPALVSSVGTQGDYYVVNVAGTTNLNGISDWQIGDWAIFNGSVWQKVDNTDAVTSVNGQVGTVVLTAANVNAVADTATITAGTGLTGGGNVASNVTIALANTAVSPDTYGGGTNAAQVTVDQQGRITAAANVAIPQGTVTNVATGTGLTGGPITSTGTISLANTTVTAGTYGGNTNVSVVTVDAQGRITAASNVAIDFPESFSNISVDSIDFNTAANITVTESLLTWNNEDRISTLDLGLKNNIPYHLGEEVYYRVKLDGAANVGQVMMFTGTTGASGGLKAAPATGLLPTQSDYVLGLAKESGVLNDWIYVQSFGEVQGINTTGGAESWTDGTELYYNPSVTGGLTKTKPTAPNAIVKVAAVVHAASNGTLFVRVTYGTVLGGTDGNVNFTSLANNDVIVYNTTSNVWINKPNANLVASTGLAGGGVLIPNTSVSLELANTAVTPATYGSANTAVTITVDQQGRLTNASNATIAISNSQVSGLGTMSTQNANNVAITGGTISVSNLTASNVSVTANLFANLATSNTAAMPDPSLPLNPEGYLTVVINGAAKKIPYYGV
jgi:hypothetical protein